MSDPIAGLISERYRLGALLGTGGSASVFSAIDIRSGEAIALKVLHPELSRTPRLREAFFREARAAGGIRHPNIVAVLDVGVHDDAREPLAWIALELAAGETLAEHVGHSGPLSVADTLTLASAVLRGLAATHDAGLIHRDVSPANIMIAPASTGALGLEGVRLFDFGLADAAGRAATGSDVLRSEPEGEGEPAGVLGSVNYMSPEQAAGIPVDERGDLYQLGGVLYFALTGHAPFPRPTAAAVMRAHALTPPPVPSVTRPGIPRGVDRIVVRALLKHRDDRFPSAAAMLQALAALAPQPPRVGLAGSDVTHRFDARPAGVSAAGHDRTVVLPAVTGARAYSAPPQTRPRRARAGRADGWVALALVAVVVAAGWVAAAGGSAGSSVAVSSPPSPAATPFAAPTPSARSTAPSTAPPRLVADVFAPVQVPELSMMSLGEARLALEKAGLRLGGFTTQESVRAGDTLLSLEPTPGSWLAPGGAVNVVLASGSNRVPATLSLTQAEAVAAVQNAGFIAAIDTRPDTSAEPGTVAASQPGESTVLRLGTTVSLTVAEALPPPTSLPAPVPGPTKTPEASPSPTPAP